jgi:hypothetical protein
MDFDTLIDAKLEEKIDERLPSLVERAVARISQASPWMTEKQLADYWQVSVESIRKWSKQTEHPLPCGSMGEMRRYHRDDADIWARKEADRRRAPKRSAPRAIQEST